MRKSFKVIIVSFIFAFTISAKAGGGLPANKITKVSFHERGFFLYADGWTNPNECTQATAIVLKNTDSNYDKAYSLLLAAYMAGKKISGYSDGCIEHDGQTYNAIRGFKYLTVE